MYGNFPSVPHVTRKKSKYIVLRVDENSRRRISSIYADAYSDGREEDEDLDSRKEFRRIIRKLYAEQEEEKVFLRQQYRANAEHRKPHKTLGWEQMDCICEIFE